MNYSAFDQISDSLMDLVDNEELTPEEIAAFLQKEMREIHQYFDGKATRTKKILDGLQNYAVCDI